MNKNKSSIMDRMKENYEKPYKICLTRRTPVIIRLDGKAFHTFTKRLEKPFCEYLHDSLVNATKNLLSEIQGAKFAYVQSDEISILVTDYDTIETQPYFGYSVQKIASVSASLMTQEFIKHYYHDVTITKNTFLPSFDSRVFNVPTNDVQNYFIARQQDWYRNAIQMLGQANFSHKELHKKSCKNIIEMLSEKQISLNDYDEKWQHGSLVFKSPFNPIYGDVKNLSKTFNIISNLDDINFEETTVIDSVYNQVLEDMKCDIKELENV